MFIEFRWYVCIVIYTRFKEMSVNLYFDGQVKQYPDQKETEQEMAFIQRIEKKWSIWKDLWGCFGVGSAVWLQYHGLMLF